MNIIPEYTPDRLRVYVEPEELAAAVAEQLARYVNVCISQRGTCHMILPGGRTVCGILKKLREQRIPWSVLHIYISDERCLPRGDQNRNDRLINELLIKHITLPPANWHSIRAELGPERGAEQYRSLLDRLPYFDIALLGAGADGHVASLFPGHVALKDRRSSVPVFNAPKAPPERVSIGLTRLKEASERWVVVAGSEKRNVLLRARRGERLPVTTVRPTAFFADTKAAAAIRNPRESSFFT